MELEKAMKNIKRDIATPLACGECTICNIEDLETILTHLTKQEKMIDEIKNKLEEHIQHCKQEARGSLHNEICHISLKFDESLLNFIDEKKAEESK